MMTNADRTPAKTEACAKTESMAIYVNVNPDSQDRSARTVSQLCCITYHIFVTLYITHAFLCIIQLY